MNLEYFNRILELQKRKIQDEESRGVFLNNQNLIDWISGELEEVSEEISGNNTVYLEDELGDVFWCYVRLLYSLEQEGRISMESIFSRVEKKFLERVEAVEQNISWEEIKKKQKIQRKKECTNL